MKFFVSLSSKTALFASIMVCVATSIIAALVFYSSKTFFLESSKKSLNSEATLLTIEIENSFERVAKDLMFLSHTPPIKGIIRSYNHEGIDVEGESTIKIWKQQLSIIFRSLLELNPDYTQLRYIGVANRGKELVRVNRSRYEVHETDESCLQMKADTDYFKQGVNLDHGSLALSDVTYNREKGKLQYPLVPTLRIMKAVYGDIGGVFGLLVVNLNYEQFLKNILLNSLSEHNVLLYNSQGDFFEYDSYYKTLKFTKHNDANKNNKKKSIRDIISSIENDPNQVIVSRPIHLIKGTSQTVLTLVISITKKELFKYDQVIINNIIMLILFITMISVGITFFFSRWLMRNLRKMTAMIQNTKLTYKRDDFPTHLHDEIGILARAFLKKTELLKKLALHDHLTKLPNRKNLMDYLKKAVLRAKRNKTMLAVCFIDLNNFKHVNDRYGHDYGDELLIMFSKKLTSLARATDFIGRLGGDEFVIVVENLKSIEDLTACEARYSKCLKHQYTVKDVPLDLSISIGVSLYPMHATNANELIKDADSAMYQGKTVKAGEWNIFKPKAL
tara:strand:+ start:24374 stop:26053 length:1680 start_codon:yes stop_codon:yes gene_type:complete